MMKILMTAMKTSISEVMETMFFLPVEFGEKATIVQYKMNNNKSIMAGRLKFTGDVAGTMYILVPRDLIGEMAQDFMGQSSEDLEEDHFSGTLTEMLNMVCGNTLSKIDSKVPYELGIPELMDESDILETQIFTMVETPQSMMAINITMD